MLVLTHFACTGDLLIPALVEPTFIRVEITVGETGTEDDNVHICGSPLYHTAVLMFSSTSLHMGHAVVLSEKWDAEDMLRLLAKVPDQVSNAVDDDAGLATSGSGENQHRAVCRRHGLVLPGVEGVKQGGQRCKWDGVSNAVVVLYPE